MCTCGGVGGAGGVGAVRAVGGLGGCISGGGKGEQQFCIVVQAEKEAETQSRGEILVEIRSKFPRVGWKFGGNFNQTSMGGGGSLHGSFKGFFQVYILLYTMVSRFMCGSLGRSFSKLPVEVW